MGNDNKAITVGPSHYILCAFPFLDSGYCQEISFSSRLSMYLASAPRVDDGKVESISL